MRWLIALGVVLIAMSLGALVLLARLARAQPDVELVAITTTYPGASPLVVEREVSEPLETAVAGLPGVVEVRSESREGISFVLVTVRNDGVDGFVIASEVQQAVAPKLATLPREVTPPMVQRLLSPKRTTHRRWVVRSDERPIVELSSWVDDVLRRELERQQGVRAVERCGIVEQVVELRPDVQRLAAFGLSPLDVQSAVAAASAMLPGGLANNNNALAIRATGGVRSLDELADLALNDKVKLRDVATVALAAKRPTCRALTHGMNVVFVDVISEGPLEKELVLPSLPSGIRLEEVKVTGTSFYAVQDERALGELSRLGVALQHEGDAKVEVLLDGAQDTVRNQPGIALVYSEGDTVVRLSGLDLQELDRQAAMLRAKLSEALPANTVGGAMQSTRPELSVTPTERTPEVMQLIALAVGGRDVGQLSQGAQRLDVRIVLGSLENKSDAMDALRALRLRDGRPLDSVVNVELREAPAGVLRVNRQRSVELFTSAKKNEVKAALEKLQLPTGIAVTIAP